VQTAGDLLVYRRLYDGRALLVALNFSNEPASMHVEGDGGEIALTTELDRSGENVSGVLGLRGNEGVIVRLR
jgi:alpha-glucosidase